MSSIPDPTSTTPATSPARTPTRRAASPWPWLLLVLAFAGAGWYGWQQWQARDARERNALADAEQRLGAHDDRLEALRRDQRAQTARLQQADATNRVLRDELLGLGQRAALLEDSVSKLADPDRHGAQALRLDEAELLLTLGLQRLSIAGDLDGARRAYALAAGVLDGIDDPAYLSLRQTLGQERTALDAVGVEPRVQALAKLDALAATFAAAPGRETGAQSARAPWWRRAFAKIIAVQPSDSALAIQPADRAAALAGLQLEITLARAAAERRDADGYRAALLRAQGWLPRLWSDAAVLQRRRAQLEGIATMPLSLTLPALGSTLEQLRQMRASS